MFHGRDYSAQRRHSINAMIPTLVRDIVRGLGQIVYPPACLACGQGIGDQPIALCDPCRERLIDEPHETCRRCASTIGPNLPPADDCPQCRDKPLAFDRVVRLGPYDGLRREIILKIKHVKHEALAAAAAAAWVCSRMHCLRDLGIVAVVPAPLHWRRQWMRGYNQAEALAEAWASGLGVAIRRRWLRRVRPTQRQTSLAPTARFENVRNAFAAGRDPRMIGATILFVDDVVTTGATASEAARALKRAGAARVIVAALGHG